MPEGGLWIGGEAISHGLGGGNGWTRKHVPSVEEGGNGVNPESGSIDWEGGQTTSASE